LYFWFILKDEAPVVARKEIKTAWLEKLIPSARFSSIDGDFTRYDIMKVADYLGSDQVDLDRLSPE